MAPSFNQVVLVGNLTRDPEVKYTQGGSCICSFGLAVNEREKKGEEWVDRPSFFDVTVFGKTAEAAAKALAKGKSVLVAGRLRQDRWEDNGQKRQAVKVIADTVKFLSPKGEGASADSGADEDVPF